MNSEMKTLEQLGISPAPWSVTPNNLGSEDVTANDSTVVVAYEPPFEEAKDSINKRLIAAAPELFEALYDVVAYCDTTHLVPSERFGKVLAKVKAALAKAGGEK